MRLGPTELIILLVVVLIIGAPLGIIWAVRRSPSQPSRGPSETTYPEGPPTASAMSAYSQPPRRGPEVSAYPEGRPPWRPLTTSGLAVASLVLGIVWAFWIGSILAVIFGHIALGQIKRSQGSMTGRGMAIAGVVLGWVGVGLLVLTIALGVVGYITSPNHDYAAGKCINVSDEVVACDGNEWGQITSEEVDPDDCSEDEYWIESNDIYYCLDKS